MRHRPDYGYKLIFYAYMVFYHYGIEMYAVITLPLIHCLWYFHNKQQHAVASLVCDPNDIRDQACIK